ncbi:MAG: protein rep [Hyphomicrobiaceae bacterium]|nr:protein rep [Hyphomicrobiaceae bacterium]
MPTRALRKVDTTVLRLASDRVTARALANPPADYVGTPAAKILTGIGRRQYLCCITRYLHRERTEDGALRVYMSNRRACHSRLCMECSAAHSKVLVEKTRRITAHAWAAEPSMRALFLTLTERSAVQGQLRPTLQAHAAAIKRLFAQQRIAAAINGSISSIEVAPRLDNGRSTFGVHSHHLLAVRSDYFSTAQYIRQAEFVARFQQARGLDYRPVVDVRTVQIAAAQCEADAAHGIAVELMKYVFKPSHFIHRDGHVHVDSAVVAELALALRNKRTHRLSGCFEVSRKALQRATPKQRAQPHEHAEQHPF